MKKNKKIRIGIVGLGNCATSLLQGIEHYSQPDRQKNHVGLLYYNLGGYLPEDIEIVAAFDIDKRKVGKPIHEAIYAHPNCVYPIKASIEKSQITVKMGHILDGVSDHMRDHPEHRTFLPSDAPPQTWPKN
jgi:myo-inositol-1-phosphate synthase